ncbi:DUF3089 domain-containing protein [Paraglaciecola sp.]|uniref:DUF3089 domain-containing protein n=1 Tax=Paraglaciecola sp. TaxID=1920173 RepID=UPI00273FF526|nr:DUF3089 domain-containing protein [Paraglaciecola sp.]MDP5030391.1 DUF3089 domain-containing protein [Paraglaciecola sp.]
MLNHNIPLLALIYLVKARFSEIQGRFEVKKKYKYLIGGLLTVSVVITVGVISIKPLLGYLMVPEGVFDSSMAPPKPDYSVQASWLTLPDKVDYADMVPEGLKDEQANAPADVFYIHPTAYYGNSNWNSDMSSEKGAAQIVEYMVATQASIFNACCKVYSPQFREATLSAFMRQEYGALELAYDDVQRAFEYFLQYQNKGRPFIILSHSQGTTHALRLLEEYIIPRGLVDHMVVAYLIGYELPLDKFSRGLKSIKPCGDEQQTHCIVSWATYGETSDPEFSFNVPHWYPEGWEWSNGKDTLCVNPLSWRTDEVLQTKDKHQGTVLTNPLTFFYKNVLFDKNTGENPQYLQLYPNFTRAQCRHGRLYIETQRDNSISASTNELDQNYHANDINLFYMNLRQNAQLRVTQFLQRLF